MYKNRDISGIHVIELMVEIHETGIFQEFCLVKMFIVLKFICNSKYINDNIDKLVIIF